MLQIEMDQSQNRLALIGELNAHSLHTIWAKQKDLFKIVNSIDVTELVHVDASGLALLVYFCNEYAVKLVGITPQLQALIDLYDLQKVIDE